METFIYLLIIADLGSFVASHLLPSSYFSALASSMARKGRFLIYAAWIAACFCAATWWMPIIAFLAIQIFCRISNSLIFSKLIMDIKNYKDLMELNLGPVIKVATFVSYFLLGTSVYLMFLNNSF